MKSSELSSTELFAGAGGFAIGLERAGFRPSLLIETDSNSIATIRSNRPSWNVVPESTTLHGPAFPATDLLVADLPSGSVSEASTSIAEDSVRARYQEVIKATGSSEARSLIVQGVRSLASSRFRPALDSFRQDLESLGYVSDWRLINASHFGVPQLRPRMLLVAIRSDTFARFDWPLGAERIPSLGETLLPVMKRAGWEGAEKWAGSAVGLAPTIIGGSPKHGGADLGPTRTKRAWLVLGVDPRGVAEFPPTGDTPSSVLPRLTNEMIAAIQAFPPDWRFVGSRTSVFRQVARSTPPPVAEGIGRAIANALRQAR